MHDVSLDSALHDSALGASRTELLRASPPMFRWPWLDRLSRVHPVVVPLIYVPAIALLALLGASHVAAASFAIACGIRRRHVHVPTAHGAHPAHLG